MAGEKMINGRLQLKHDTEANWNLAAENSNFIPKNAEPIVYDIDEGHARKRFKIGDGKTNVKDLEFIEQVQPDWNQNDESALDYVKNRTHWEEKSFEEILPEATLTMTYFSDRYIGAATVDHTKMILDKIYTIVWDGVEYESQSFIVENATEGEIIYTVAIGNPTFVGLGDDNGIPIMCTNAVNNGEIIDTFAVVTASSGETHTISISANSSVAHQLDEKFIPSTIARVSDIPSLDGFATKEYVDAPKMEFILKSSTEGSTKQFKITIDDEGVLTTTEIVESEA